MYVYRTSQFNRKTLCYGVQAQVDKLCNELEPLSIDESQARFERVYPYLKRRGENNLRLIARIRSVQDDLVLCLLDIFLRGSKEYKKFLRTPEEYGKKNLDCQLDEEALTGWLQQQQPSASNVSSRREPLPDDLLPWLEPPGWEIEKDKDSWVILYESDEWIAKFKSPEIGEDWEIYYQIISGIEEKSRNAEKIAAWPGVYLCGENNCYVLFSQLETADTLPRKVLFLLASFAHRPSTEEIAKIGEATNLFDGSKNVLSKPLTLDELTPFARRSYPSYLVTDKQSWLAIQRGAEVNLALSAEEEAILNSVSTTSARGNNCLPLFLNGRAGSGKSTMLLYLFADYCYRKYYYEPGKELPGKPLFLTYNKRLLEVAKEFVRCLHTFHHRFVADRTEGSEIPDVSAFFQPFGTFLLNLLPLEADDASLANRMIQQPYSAGNPTGYPHTLQERFDSQKYISFHRFRQLYRDSKLPQAQVYSPELSWHVIRTFIKGYSLRYMTPEDYQDEVPTQERTVPVAQFQEIYKTIWGRWYKRLTTELGYWDDQDLIRLVLELKCYRAEYTAIFCDEAQDFTRLELQLIMRLSAFSQCDLGYQPMRNLPFAFAGDPFQTLNPTGFRWESVQAAFYNEAIAALDPTQRLNLRMNFPELKSNYRSCTAVVQVINLIQLCRQVLFKIPALQPQTAWKQGHFPTPQKFIIGRNIQIEQLKHYLRDTIIIVPCEEGGELTYAQNDAVLSQILVEIPESEPLKNVLSASAVKGLEFKRVVLYKFGEECNKAVWNLANRREDSKDLLADRLYEFEFFFNKLYVAASRAKERLFVVDSQIGDQRLWGVTETYLEVLLQHSQNPAWRENVQPIRLGKPESARDLQEDDWHSIAQEFESRGMNSEDPDFMRRARQCYSDRAYAKKAEICEAWALKFEQKFSEAGQRFLVLGKTEDAWDCFWQGMCWSALLKQFDKAPPGRESERQIAQFMDKKLSQPSLKEFTHFLQYCIKSNQLEIHRNSRQWKLALEEYATGIGTLIAGTNLHPNEWQRFGEVLEALGEGWNGMLYRAGTCFYRAKNYERAAQCWERCDSTQQRKYYLAKASVLGVPNGLEYLEKAGESEQIVKEWNQAGRPHTQLWLKYVAPILEKGKRKSGTATKAKQKKR
ncbi:hypothetical protein [Coleofasciculus sp. FACHB-542]|uniref:hypothetical protein n=1 Tax=Coleofasciculus sp. FACHB-542 TaxID=2692787 RepID=UPI001685C3D8|nr:hypothetical protein [Coleofasciculus sp. FACHB-542]MBD2087335.1 hypothetical protein [Coleofasciculus sp. FACHB-542]